MQTDEGDRRDLSIMHSSNEKSGKEEEWRQNTDTQVYRCKPDTGFTISLKAFS